MSLLRHNVEEDILLEPEDKPSESTARLHRASQVISAFHIHGAFHRQTFRPIGIILILEVVFLLKKIDIFSRTRGNRHGQGVMGIKSMVVSKSQ